jgi:dolichol-phosphate mannosyltransferase
MSGGYSVVVPTLNEIGNIAMVIGGLKGPGVEILVCDNGSADGTAELAGNLGARVLPGRGGVGDAVLRGIHKASCDRIIVMDADMSHPPHVARRMAEALIEHDLVVGSRRAEGGMSNDFIDNKIISKVGNVLCWGLAPGVKDRMSGFWGMKRSLRDRCWGEGVRPTAKPMLEFLVRGSPSSVGEVGYIFNPRKTGKSKIGRRWSLWQTLKDVVRLYGVKYGQVLRFGMVSGVGLGINLGLLFFLTEVAGLWYGASAGIAVGSALIWNFVMHGLWTWGDCRSLGDLWNLGHRVEDGDFEWWEWYGPHLVKRWWKRKVSEKTRELVGEHSGKRILVMGCGSSPAINEYRCDRVGVDVSREKVDFLQRHTGAVVFTRDITKPLEFLGSSHKFDIILCNEVLEHLRGDDLWRVVANMDNLLGEKGEVVVSVPNYESRIGRVVERVMHGDIHQPITAERVRSLFKDKGFRLVGKRDHLWVSIQKFDRLGGGLKTEV